LDCGEHCGVLFDLDGEAYYGNLVSWPNFTRGVPIFDWKFFQSHSPHVPKDKPLPCPNIVVNDGAERSSSLDVDTCPSLWTAVSEPRAGVIRALNRM
jgi:hypothetical protein